jgi:hypothetical protein
MVRWSSARVSAAAKRIVMALIAGVVLAVVLQLRFGAGHPAVINVIGAGAAVVSPSPSTAAVSGQTGRFGISGSVTGLYPGASMPLVLTVSNHQEFTIVVTSITTSVGSPNQACVSADLSVSQFIGSLSVPAKGTSNVTVTVTLTHGAPDACQGAVFPLQYSGTAVKP